MRVLVISHEHPPLAGGAGGAAACRSARFATSGHAVCVRTSAHGGLPAREEHGGVEVRRIAALRTRLDRGGLAHMAAFAAHGALRALPLAREFRPDAALAFFGIPGGLVAWRLRRRLGLPYVVALRGADVPGQQPEQLAMAHALCAPLLRAVWRGARAVAANGPGLAEAARRFLPGLAVTESPGGVDAELFHPVDAAPGIDRDGGPLRLLFAGRVSPEKGLDVLLRALVRVDGDWTLAVAGDGPGLPGARAEAGRLGLSAQVRWLGFVPREAMPGVYREADVLAQPSLYEGLPNAVLEAMASGLAVVTTDTPGASALVRPDTGLTVPRADAGALAEALAALCADRALVRRLGATGRATALRDHDWGAVARHYLSLLAPPGGPGA